MTQVRSPGVGAQYLASTQIPTALTFDAVPGRANRLLNVEEFRYHVGTTDTGAVAYFTTQDKGRVIGVIAQNGSTACDGSNGWKAVVTGSHSGNVVASFGFGTGTNAVAATDSAAVAASASKQLANSLTATTSYFNKGEVLTLTVTEDGTAGVIDLVFLVSYEATGYTA